MQRNPFPAALLLAAALTGPAASAAATGPPPSTELAGLAYDREFFPGTEYDPAVPAPLDCLGFRPGDRAAFPHEIERCLEAWQEASERVTVAEYARSYEDRALYMVTITSPANHARMAEIRAGWRRLADPRGLSQADGERLAEGLPGTAWLAYSIHGDETSGSDAALAVIHHLAAGRGTDVEQLLERLVVIVDPMQNPDGRHRFLQQIAEHRGAHPNVDNQSLLHAGYWPWGRTNHYGFDLNRDWILGVNPETRGRIRAIGEVTPLLVVDAHEMGSLDSYLFSPPREPRNLHLSAAARRWGQQFARDQARAFDDNGWVYYSGEWNEGWYPGYTDAFGEMRGAVGILYEQARFAEDGVRRPEGTIHTYREAVHRQAVSSLANLRTLAANLPELKRDFAADRRQAVSAEGPYADRTFAVLPTANRGRLARFVDLLRLLGFELYEAGEEFTAATAVDQLGRSQRRAPVPAGSLLIPNRQPLARLVATTLEFDQRVPEEPLRRERTEIVRGEGSTIYDLTAWNLTMLYGLEALTLSGGLPPSAVPLAAAAPAAPAPTPTPDAVAWVIDGADDASLGVAGRLMERGVEVRVARRPFTLGESSFARASLVVLPIDNRGFTGDLAATVAATATEGHLAAVAVATGLGEGDLPDLGGGLFVRLERPRIALAGRGGASVYDFGSIWHLLDQRLGLRHSHLDLDSLGDEDLRRYNVLVLPDRWFGELGEAATAALGSWVEAGGTLVAIGGSAAELAADESQLSRVRLLRDVQDELDRFERAVLREHLAATETLPAADEIWRHTAGGAAEPPWSAAAELTRPSAEELEQQDRWRRQFMPQGAILAARVDPDHWLGFGAGELLPVLYRSSRVLMSDVETPVRIGFPEPAGNDAVRRVGWLAVPAGRQLRLRMSGLLWPEAAARLAGGALVTRERRGRGQVILFAEPPAFRGSTPGTERLLANALVLGPGFGARAPIHP